MSRVGKFGLLAAACLILTVRTNEDYNDVKTNLFLPFSYDIVDQIPIMTVQKQYEVRANLSENVLARYMYVRCIAKIECAHRQMFPLNLK